MNTQQMQASPIHSQFGARHFDLGDKASLRLTNEHMQAFDSNEIYGELRKLGINLPIAEIKVLAAQYAMDAIQQPQTTPNIATPVQFLQNWLPGFVRYLTAARKIDRLVGIATVGNWGDEQVVQGVLESSSQVLPYGDLTNIPLSSWNPNWVTRSNVRFESGFRVGKLEEYRSAQARISSAEEKRRSSMEGLEIQRNLVGFYGYNAGLNLTYGLLNDPNLPAYVQVALNGAATSRLWSQKTYLEIVADILAAVQALRNQSQDTIDPETTPMTLAIATAAVDYLATVSQYGNSVRDWLTATYPKIRVESAPQFNNANASANVFYLYADNVEDGSTDGGATFIQVVASKFQLVGVQQLAKGTEEDYSNATAGIITKRPYAVVRRYGI